MKKTMLIPLSLVLTCCSPCKHLVNSDRDSTHVEVREIVKIVRDTSYIEVPREAERITTPDSTSHLENEFAQSDARINHDGSLFHSLETKPQRKPVPVDKEIIYRDSIAYRDREVERIVQVERKLSKWEQFQMKGFWIALSIVIVFVGRKLLPLIRRFI